MKKILAIAFIILGLVASAHAEDSFNFDLMEVSDARESVEPLFQISLPLEFKRVEVATLDSNSAFQLAWYSHRVTGAVGSGGGASGEIGTTSTTDTASLAPLTAYHSKFQPNTAGQVRYGHLKLNDGNARTICLSLWDASGNELLSGSDTASDDEDGDWLNVDAGEAYTLVAETNYYAGAQVSDTTVVYRAEAASGTYVYSDASYTYDCGGDITAEENQVTNTRQLTIIWNNTPGDPE